MSRIITIGREFGSGGRELGRRLAEELGYVYYDQEIVTQIAQRPFQRRVPGLGVSELLYWPIKVKDQSFHEHVKGFFLEGIVSSNFHNLMAQDAFCLLRHQGVYSKQPKLKQVNCLS